MRISDWSSDVCSSDLGPGQHLGGHRVHAAAAGEEGVDGLGGRVGDDEGLPNGDARGELLADEDRAVDHERAVLRARSAAPREAPQQLHAGMSGADRGRSLPRPPVPYAVSLCESVASLAAPTRAVNAAGSRTARSARTLRRSEEHTSELQSLM